MVGPGIELVAAGGSLVAALFFGLEGIVGKRGIEAGGDAILASLVVATVSLTVFGGVAAIVTDPATLLSRNPVGIAVFLLSGALSSGLGVLATWQGVDRVGASINTAIVNGRPLFATLLGFLFLAETPRPSTVAGIVVVVAGLVLVGLSKGGDVRGWETASLLFPLAAAVAFAAGNVGRRYALTRTDLALIEGIAFNAAGGLAVLGLYVAATGRGDVLSAPRRAYGWFVLTGLVTASALLALFFALQRELVAIVDSIVATAPLFTLAFTWLFLRDVERVTTRLLVGAVLVVVGTVVIVV